MIHVRRKIASLAANGTGVLTSMRLALTVPDGTIPEMAKETLAGQFPSTEWTLVLAAGGDTSRAASALEKLCRVYWQPLYAYARRKGYAPAVSEDAVQGFLHTVIARRSIENVEVDGRRFRSWLLGGFGHHLANIHRHENAARRGGGSLPLSIDEAEAALPSDPSLSPDQAYDRRWAQLVLTAAMTRLREQQGRAGRAESYAALEPVVTMQAKTPYRDLADRLGISEQAVSLQVFRLRQRLRDLVRSEVARTVLTPEDLEAELSYLLDIFRR
jgi:RNA polymerase sigma factor (sigma-70 family)